VRDEARKAEVIANARSDAGKRGLPADKIEQMWELLVETSIGYELIEWDRIRA
jgi:isochorismate pyruvate lyase